ncbi:MAG: flagellar protein FlaG [Porticoccus sp.]|nr:flagellar protein FlaG [Porticoccus sp.]MBQ0807729.1 flagellar protein FlaG [Porticoccus sp.]
MTSPLSNDLTAVLNPTTNKSSGVQHVEKVLDQLPLGKVSDAPVRYESLVKPIQQINEVIRPYGVKFDLSEKSSQIVTQIVDLETGKVIRQTPSEDVLRIAERLDEVSGLLINEEA